tara:strand:- start:24126 stop:24431 length:306 start_codon:yes stop_codon:yes gene_type:complete
MSNTQHKIKQLFKLLEELEQDLIAQDGKKFQMTEMRFSDGLKSLLDSNKHHLEDMLEDLILLNKTIAIIQKKSEQSLTQLREQTLQHKRNKNKIKAYGKNT